MQQYQPLHILEEHIYFALLAVWASRLRCHRWLTGHTSVVRTAATTILRGSKQAGQSKASARQSAPQSRRATSLAEAAASAAFPELCAAIAAAMEGGRNDGLKPPPLMGGLGGPVTPAVLSVHSSGESQVVQKC